MPVTLCRHAQWLATVPVFLCRFGFDWANARLVPTTVMIAATVAIFFMLHPRFLLSYDNTLSKRCVMQLSHAAMHFCSHWCGRPIGMSSASTTVAAWTVR